MIEPGVRDVAEAWSEVAVEDFRDVSQEYGRRAAFLRRADQPARTPGARVRSRNGNRKRGFGIFSLAKRLWIPLVIVVVIGAGGLTVSRLQSIFGSEKRPSYADTQLNDTKPFDPKHLTYEVFGPPGSVADISYFDVNADPQRIEGVRLPWSVTFATTEATAVGNVVAQGDGDSIGCRIVVDGEVKAERITHEVSAFTFCVLKPS